MKISNIFIKMHHLVPAILLTLAVTATLTGCGSSDSMDFVENMGVGWNLGNSLECNFKDGEDTSIDTLETYWGNPLTTKKMIDEISDAGFKTLRIPVNWSDHTDENGTIDPDWLARVAEVADYGLDNDMYVILNCHHDNRLIPTYDEEETSTATLTAIWNQVAGYFKDYDVHLLFEGMNEVRLIGTDMEWGAGTEESWNVINSLNQTFVDTVRNSGGNNKERYLLVPTYCDSTASDAISNFKLPDGKNLIVTVHAYLPYEFCHEESGSVTWSASDTADTSPISDFMDNLYDTFTSKGIPVILGEFGTIDKDNTDARAACAKYYVDYAKEKQIMCIWWDNGAVNNSSYGTFQIFDRDSLTFVFPEIRDALIQN